MSKVDAQRAMRDARYARFAAAKAAETVPAKKAAKAPAAKPAAARAGGGSKAAEPSTEELFSAPAADPGEAVAEPTPAKADAGSRAGAELEAGAASEVAAGAEVGAEFRAGAASDSGAEPASGVVLKAEGELQAADVPQADDDEPEAEGELCGHRSMNGRTCTRAKGHPQKNHRYN